MTYTHTFHSSAMLNSCSYDDETKEMTVIFSNGKPYIFEDVDKSIYDSLISAESAGRYFNSIKAQLKVKKS